MFTRAQYLNKECTHREYWAQFVTAGMKSMVARNFSLERLQRSQNEYFNDVTVLSDWEIMRGNTFAMLDLKKWREIQYPEYTDPRSIGWSMSDNTCLLKEAARQLVEEAVDTTVE
jgi:hypothetical protein